MHEKIYQELLGTAQYKRHDDYVNATQLCQHFGKRFPHYERLGGTVNFLNACAEKFNKDVQELVQSPGRGHSGDTWIHPIVGIHLAQWLDVDFAVEVAGTFKHYLETNSVLSAGSNRHETTIHEHSTTSRGELKQ